MIPDAATGRGNPFSTSQKQSSRSDKLRAALDYAGRGIPVFPCRPDKSPHWVAGVLEHGHLDATTDRSRITAWWNRWPNANIGMPTGERSGVFVLDVDDLKALAKLEAAIGAPPATKAVRTPSGGLHLYFHHAVGITNRPGALPDGIDVRGEGGYVLVPPSSGYRSEAGGEATRAVAHAPEQLLQSIRGKKEPGPGKDGPGSSAHRRPVSIDVAGPQINNRGRNVALTAIAGRLHDGSRTLKELEEDLDRINRARCPHPLERKEVAKIARSIHRRPPCRRARPEEIEQVIRDAEERFWELVAGELEGLRGQSVRDALRTIIKGATLYGRLRPDGCIEYDQSLFETALAAGISRPTLNLVRPLLFEKTGIRRVPRRTPTDAGAWVLPGGAGNPDAQPFTTHTTTLSSPTRDPVVRVVKGCAPPTGLRRLADAQTPCSRHFSPTNKGKGGVLLVLEIFGEMDREALAAALGIKRLRDLERRYLVPLLLEGRVVLRDGRYSLPADHARRCEEACQIPYGGGERLVRTRTSEGRTVAHTVEREAMSEAQRDERDRRLYAKQLEKYLDYLTASTGVRAQEDEDCQKLLNAWYDERYPSGSIEELELAPVADSELIEALVAYLERYPRRRSEPANWLSIAMWADGYTPTKAPAAKIAAALPLVSNPAA